MLSHPMSSDSSRYKDSDSRAYHNLIQFFYILSFKMLGFSNILFAVTLGFSIGLCPPVEKNPGSTPGGTKG